MSQKIRCLMATAKYPILYAFVILSFSVQLNYAENIYTLVNTYFISIDSLFGIMAAEVSKISNLDPSDKYFLDRAGEYPQFEYLMRTNSKGKIISKVSNNKIAPRNYRVIGGQVWYKTLALTKKPYYGNISQRKGHFLFWNRPILVKTRRGSRFGGSVAVKINIKKCFKDIANKNNVQFEIIYKKETLFSNIGKNISGPFVENKLGVYGMPGLVLKHSIPGAKPASTTSQVAQPPGEKTVATKEKALKAPQKGPVKKAALSKKNVEKKAAVKKAEKHKGGVGSIVVLVILIIVGVLVVVVCFIAMKRAADKRRKLIEAIDKGEI